MKMRAAAPVFALVLSACGTEQAVQSREATGGTLVVSAAADADLLIPPLSSQSSGRQVIDQIFDRLAEIGDDLSTTGDSGFTPELAERWTWSDDSLSIAFHLRPGARWHDGKAVTASDVQFSYALYTNPLVASPSASLLANIDSVTVRDSATVVFWYARRTPGQFYETTYSLHIMPRHLLDTVPVQRLRESAFARNPVGSGRFRFAARTPSASIELVSDTANYRGRALLDRVIWLVAPDFNTAVTRFLSREADLFELLRPEQLAEIARSEDLRSLTLPSLDYAFIQFNLRDPRNRERPHPVLGDRDVRRALSMAVNRSALVSNVFDSLAVVGIGPVSRGLQIADTTVTQIPHDTVAARALLDSLGWRDSNGDGVRDRSGRQLRLTLLVPSSSRNRVRMAVLLQEQLRSVGVQIVIEQLDYAAFMERSRQRRFDAVFGAWHIDAGPHGIRQTWGSMGARTPNGLNFGSYESPAFDSAVDSALSTSDMARSRAHFRRAQEIIVADAAAIWMYEPRVTIGLHARLRPMHVRPDAWWAGLADWSVDPAERLARDQLGIGTSTR